MPNVYPRRTVIAAVDVLSSWPHSRIDKFTLKHELSAVAPHDPNRGPSAEKRAHLIAKHLLEDPDTENEYGVKVSNEIVEELIQSAVEICKHSDEFDYEYFRDQFGVLASQLELDGFTVQDGQLRRALPKELDLPQADDEVHALLIQFKFSTLSGHLDQAIRSHTRGDWASANGQLRTFVEGLFDEIASELAEEDDALPERGHQRRQWLANLASPFYGADLNEWTNNGKGFLEAFYRRLHPEGAHPGLSDEDDSTFRLHIVLIVARLLLRRLDRRICS